MAAIEHEDYWQSRVAVRHCQHPPAEWTHVTSFIDHVYGDEWWERIETWLGSDEAAGSYAWHYQEYLNHLNDRGTMWAFSDATTAIAFKLRFG